MQLRARTWIVRLLLLSVGVAVAPSYANAQTTDVIDNGRVQVGISSTWGGVITKLAYSLSSWFNFVDNGLPDTGRSIQVSLYQAGEPYINGWPCAGGTWGWNPVQAGTMSAGSCSPVGSGVLSLSNGGSWLYSSTQPMHWNPNLGRSNVVIEQTVQFVGAHNNVVRLDYTVHNSEGFTISRTHEAPVAYITNYFNHHVVYNGPSPWTYGPVSEVGNGNPGATEPWIAVMLQDADTGAYTSGVALYVPDYPQGFNFQAVSGATAVQNWRDMTIPPGASASFTAFLVLGSLDEIRSTIYALSGH